MIQELPTLSDIERIHGREVRDQVKEALALVPWSFSRRDEIGIIHNYTYPFAKALRKKTLDILQQQEGLSRLQQICTRTAAILARGKVTVQESFPAFDHHIGTGISDESIERPVDCYQLRSLVQAEIYLTEEGILEPDKK